MVGESDSEVEGEAWRLEREDTSEEEEEEVDDEVCLSARGTVQGWPSGSLLGQGWGLGGTWLLTSLLGRPL